MQWKREGRKGTDKDFEGMWKDVKNQRERETDKLKRTKFKESRKGQKVINLFEGGGEKKKGTRNYANETWEKREEKKQENEKRRRELREKKKQKKSRWEDNENQGKKERKFKNGGKGKRK